MPVVAAVVPQELLDQIDEAARRSWRTRSAWIRQAIVAALDAEHDKPKRR
jgi:metal-responsive CopG/Arc/MetJ family transcriptional regulator